MVDNLAQLARLCFDEAEKEAIRSDLEKMVAFVEKLQEIDTTGVQPLMHMGDAANVLRDDEVQGSVSRAEALLNCPSPSFSSSTFGTNSMARARSRSPSPSASPAAAFMHGPAMPAGRCVAVTSV